MIELKNIHKQFDEKVILDDFSYQFENGQSYALTGMSGSGKTTLLNMIGKIEKPDTGDVLIDQKQLRKIPEQVYFQNYAGYLFQNYGLIDNETIEQNLTLAFVGKRIKKAEQKSQMLAALKQVNLTLDLSRKVYSLSGGEAQRVAIAKIILKKPMIILADEPTAALDEKNGQEVVDLMKQLVTDDTILIVATHNPMVWEQLNQRVKLD
ncbi:MAG: putative bacteriocin export ABC transporter [Leuconostoc gelidum]|jgi:putative ABC transport system ATP-binding protein|uniref:Bacteriocin export ABC transporter n=1 Tax=Leuconostoc gelidum subsp. gelidum TaxID=1607839 RepID=A0AB35FYL6_LEUGE|nr:putative bacteriocin export ABC transporter [Leuconostoc gelidum]AFS41242.1 ABC transporter ATP-binding protein [Leuconostoc gelidum JB7]MBZ5965091.1 putative bacteriocin export ABC transporter [Leuconostoc gelidum subsp. gelidum]MBZ5974344.1 putative bacteriocin export ABC transporter [Leuconostoc gelidum subsp. gelidum]MBZ5977183.1 putative bacteriocin export ABC transporter [Leuconostoc gelidum subsp. gelidum]MBZ5979525.1 putative bacteriocin export ABC transporter [Leuconostoc gelidum s